LFKLVVGSSLLDNTLHCTGSNELLFLSRTVAVRQARQLLKKLPTKVSGINKYTLAMDIFKIKIDSRNFMFLMLK
jgi:hypothetical protein